MRPDRPSRQKTRGLGTGWTFPSTIQEDSVRRRHRRQAGRPLRQTSFIKPTALPGGRAEPAARDDQGLRWAKRIGVGWRDDFGRPLRTMVPFARPGKHSVVWRGPCRGWSADATACWSRVRIAKVRWRGSHRTPQGCKVRSILQELWRAGPLAACRLTIAPTRRGHRRHARHLGTAHSEMGWGAMGNPQETRPRRRAFQREVADGARDRAAPSGPVLRPPPVSGAFRGGSADRAMRRPPALA